MKNDMKLELVRLKKWGKGHAVTGNGFNTKCGRSFTKEEKRDPRPRDGFCVQCRKRFLAEGVRLWGGQA